MTANTSPVGQGADEIHEAALKAVKATNFCTKHRLYHGQKYPSCTPQERVIVEIKSGVAMSKYPELANKEEWTPRMLYIHQRGMFIGGLFGSIITGLSIGIIEVVWRYFL